MHGLNRRYICCIHYCDNEEKENHFRLYYYYYYYFHFIGNTITIPYILNLVIYIPLAITDCILFQDYHNIFCSTSHLIFACNLFKKFDLKNPLYLLTFIKFSKSIKIFSNLIILMRNHFRISWSKFQQYSNKFYKHTKFLRRKRIKYPMCDALISSILF